MDMSKMNKTELTPLGFERVRFTDLCGEQCSLQQSSIAIYEQPGAGAVWLGCDHNRMQLDVNMVKELIVSLQNWVDSGSFEKEKRNDNVLWHNLS